MNRAAARPYLAAFGTSARRTLRKRGELAVRTLFYLVILVVFSALWKAATAAAGGPIAGYDYRDLLWYVTVAEGAVIATKPRMIEDIGNDIGSGAIAVEMLRPVSVVGFRLAAEFGESLIRMACALSLGSIVAWLFAGPPPSLPGLLLALPALPLAVACNLAAQHAFAGVAFWLNDSKTAWFLYQKLVFLLGGMLLPLQVFPALLARTAWAAPFWTMAYAPARLATGHLDVWLLAVQAGWLVVLTAVAVRVFTAGERRMEVAGG
ncbi:MAG TPA: ABC-2 family transporter protein [Actinomycetota bacterium]|nr:ABC-2 family transporter protein [Actinomycetota bacterium]